MQFDNINRDGIYKLTSRASTVVLLYHITKQLQPKPAFFLLLNKTFRLFY